MIFYKGNTPVGHTKPEKRKICVYFNRVNQLIKSRTGESNYNVTYNWCSFMKKKIKKGYCRYCKCYTSLK